MFLVLCTDTNSDSNYHDMFDGFWNERGIMNKLILIKSLKNLQAQYTLAYDPFLVGATSNKIAIWVVQPDILHELSKTHSDRRCDLHGYMLKVSMFNDRPTAVLWYDKLTVRLISKARDGQVLDIITKFMNSTPVIIQPRHKQRKSVKKLKKLYLHRNNSRPASKTHIYCCE